MSGIGDYVHYHKARYLKYGITQKNEDGGISLSSALAANRAYLQGLVRSKNVSPAACQQLSKYFSDFYYNKNKQLTSTVQIKDNNNQIVSMGAQELLAEAVKQYPGINNSKYVDGAMVQKVLQDTTSKLANTVHNKGTQFITGNTLVQYINSINQMVNNVGKAFERNQRFAEFNELYKTERDLQQAVSHLQNAMKNILAQLPPIASLKGSGQRIALTTSTTDSFSQSLQSILDEYQELIK